MLVPPILLETGKVKNPWPNVDAHSGVLLQVQVCLINSFIIFPFLVFRHEGDELLHRAIRSVACSRRDCQLGVGPCTWSAPGEAQVNVHCWTQEAGWSVTQHDQISFPGTLRWLDPSLPALSLFANMSVMSVSHPLVTFVVKTSQSFLSLICINTLLFMHQPC